MTTDPISPAAPARTPTGSGAPRGGAEGVLRGLGRNEIPVADWLCSCGHHERARGRTAVHELTHRVQVGRCPHRSTETDRRKAA